MRVCAGYSTRECMSVWPASRLVLQYKYISIYIDRYIIAWVYIYNSCLQHTCQIEDTD